MVLSDLNLETKPGVPVVLAIDASSHRLDGLKSAFETRYSFYPASSGVEALRTLQHIEHIDVLIIRQNMEPMTGAEFLRVLDETVIKPEKIIRVLIVEPHDIAGLNGSPYFGQVDLTYTRPFDPAEILAEVNRLVAQRSKEKRTSLRVRFSEGQGILVDFGLNGKVRLEEMSEHGMFLNTDSVYPEGTILPFILHLSRTETHLIGGRVTRLDPARGGFGVKFQLVDEQARKAIFRFLSDHVSLQDLSELKERYPFLRIDEMIAFRDSAKIESFFRSALHSRVEITALSDQMRVPVMIQLTAIDPGRVCILEGKELDIKFKTSDSVFMSFQNGYATYNFETTIRRIGSNGESLECFYPRVIFYSEKRAVKRGSPDGALTLEISLPAPFDTRIRGPIVDISDGGASFISESQDVALLGGTPLDSIRILSGGDVIREERGEVRHVARSGSNASTRIRYGIQFGIGRLSFQSLRTQEPDHLSGPSPEKSGSRLRMRRAVDLSEMVHKSPDVIRLENKNGEEIVGLLNYSFPPDEKPVPVVIIPPAFGKTKETLFGFALTLIENFHLLGKPLAVIRFDGIRRKGESHKDPEASEPPYEMVNASFTQGAADIRAVLDWLHLNPKLKPGPVILISFSLSALDARLILRDDVYRHQINYWISCMGTPEFRHLMIRVNCGLDFLEQYQLGIKLGVMPVLGNLVNVDAYVADGVANSVATLDQAREDMRHIDIPITWIYGEHDLWVTAEFIRDIMSVHAGAPREVISVPIGHNARTSEDALRLFGTLTSLIHRFLHQEMIHPVIPNKKDMDVMRRAEKDRLPPRYLRNRKDYWQRYLVGEKNLMGFDVLTLSDDYHQLMQDQLLALDLKPEDRLLDLGGGTGNFLEHLLDRNHPLPAHVTIADLIPEAMKQARQKLTSRSSLLGEPGGIGFLCLDVELDRFLPVRRYLDGDTGRFLALAEQIENLSLQSAERIDSAYSPRLQRILRGEKVTPDLDRWLRSQFELPEYRIICDFNQASRYKRGLASEKPSFRQLFFPGRQPAALHLPVKPGWYNKILMSLVLSYIFNPVETLREIRRIVRPGGRLVLSSMRPDTDASGPFMRLVDKIESMPPQALPPQWPKQLLLDSIRSFLNDAQALVDLEEAGTFDFFDPRKLEGLLDEAGWETVRFIPTFGDPPQGYVVEAKARETHG